MYYVGVQRGLRVWFPFWGKFTSSQGGSGWSRDTEKRQTPQRSEKLIRNVQGQHVASVSPLANNPNKILFLTELQMGLQNTHLECERRHGMIMVRALGRSMPNLVALPSSSNSHAPGRTLCLSSHLLFKETLVVEFCRYPFYKFYFSKVKKVQWQQSEKSLTESKLPSSWDEKTDVQRQ